MIVQATTRVERTMWHAPAALPPEHRLVLVALALRADADADQGAMVNASDEVLAQLTGLRPARIREIDTELAQTYGIDLRLDAFTGGTPQGYYVVPTFAPPDGCRCDECPETHVGPFVRPARVRERHG